MEQVQRVEDALEALLRWNRDSEDYRQAAVELVALRTMFRYKGMPDWTGRSPEYRDLVARIYRHVDIPPDSEATIQSTLRYHVGNELRRVAPLDQLVALGLSPNSPLDRIKSRRGQS